MGVLARRGLIELPPKRRELPAARPLPPLEAAPLEARLAELGEIELVPVCGETPELSQLWHTLMQAHPLGGGPLVGAQMRSLIGCGLDWMLLTTVPTETFAQACERLAWYAKRWGIEVYHRILKSGCNIEDRQLAGADRLEACLAIDMVVAWRVMHLVHLNREHGDRLRKRRKPLTKNRLRSMSYAISL